MSITRLLIAQTFVCAISFGAALDDQLLAEFRKTKPGVTVVHAIAEKPLLVAVTGPQGTGHAPAQWAPGQLLGVFAPRGDGNVPIIILPNENYPSAIRIARETADSITFALADPDYGVRSDDLKIFFDPRMLLPRRVVRFTPVRVRKIATAAGVLTITGTDGKQDYTARERNGVWHVTASAASIIPATPPVENTLQIPSMPVSTFGQFEQARPLKAKNVPQGAVIEEKIGPFQKAGDRIWIGKTFFDAEGTVGVGDIGYFDLKTQEWNFLHIPEMADWSVSALLVEPNTIWAGLVSNGEGAGEPGGLLQYDLAGHKATRIPMADVVEKIVRSGARIYCGTSGGFAIVEQGRVRKFAFEPQLDGSYTVVAGD